MKAMKLLAAQILLLTAAQATTPVSKVLSLLSDLQTKIVAEGDAAQKIYANVSDFCEDRSKNIQYEIKTGKAEVASLEATIEEASAKISSLSTKVEDVGGSIATSEADLKAATTIRAKEAADFKAEGSELSGIVDTLQRAIGILEREMKGEGASMVQLKNAGSVAQALAVMVQASVLSSADAGRLTALVQSSQQSQEDDEDASLGAPAAAIYKSQSGGVVETLEDLLEKAEAQLAEARNKETAALHNFQMLKQSLEDEISVATKDAAAARKGISESSVVKETAQGDLSVTTKSLAEDNTVLAHLQHDCMTKAQDFEAAVKSRGEELKALADAKKVISETTGGAEKITYGGFRQVSFLQRASSRARGSLSRYEAVRSVRDLARREHSTELAQLASRMASAMHFSSEAGEDPFAKVKGLVSEMIARLEKEASADASQKAYCDKELSETGVKNEEKTAEIEKLSTKIDQASSRSAQLKAQVSELQTALSELAASQVEADKIRQEENAAFVTNKADLEEGLEGVNTGLKILRDYYSTDDKAHAAAEGAGTSIIGFLEVVESDFSKGLAEMSATEESAAAAYEQQTKDNELEKTAKDQDVAYKTKESTDLDKAVAELTSDRSGVQTELDAVLEYLEKLKKICIAKPEAYEERKAHREAEIAGLKDALETLEGEAVLLQQGAARRTLRGRGSRTGRGLAIVEPHDGSSA